MSNDKDLGAVSATEGAAVSCSVPTDAASHAAPTHTPGPWAWEWVAEKSNEWAVGQAWREDGTPISGQIQEGEWLEDTIIERRLIGMNESGHANAADARLIAAAPELLEALKSAQDRLCDAFCPRVDGEFVAGHMVGCQRASAAIRKAEGK